VGQRAASLFTLVLYNCLVYSIHYVVTISMSRQLWQCETIAGSSEENEPIMFLELKSTNESA